MSAPAAAAGSSAAVSSGSKRSFPGPATERRVQPRHFCAGPSSAAASASASSATGDGAASVESDQPPPATRLYRHALESIFAFLDQRELAAALQVSRSWLGAVKSMASLQLTIKKLTSPMCVVAESAMGRHVTQLGPWGAPVPLTADSLFIAARLMPQLQELSCTLQLPPTQGRLTFPPALQALELLFTGGPAVADVNAALNAISRLPLLEALTVHLPFVDSQLSFAPLASMPQLENLGIVDQANDGDELSDAQVVQLRALPHLQLLIVQPMRTTLLRRLLAPPHDLQCQEVVLPPLLDDEAAALLPQLPSLTVLDATVLVSHFDWLQRLPNITRVDIRIAKLADAVATPMESLVAGLRCCTNIEFLRLIRCPDLRAAHLTDLLPQLLRLSTLALDELDIDSLSFLSQPPMTHQLSSLTLSRCEKLPLTEMCHVHALRGLKSLTLDRSFNSTMDALCQSLHTPPSLQMPQLEDFKYTPPQP